MDKLKILQVYDYMKLGGAESHIITLSKALIDKGHIVHIASSAGPAVSRISKLGITFHELDLYNSMETFANAEKLLNIIEEENIDIVHVHPFQSQVVMSLVKLIKQVPIVTTIHGPYITPSVKGLEDFFDGFIFVSEETKEFHFEKSLLSTNFISVIPNSVPFMLNDEIMVQNIKEILKIIYVSRLDMDKYPSILFFLNCIEQIIQYLNVEITILGQGNKYNEVCEIAKNINLKLGKKVVNVTNGAVNVLRYMEKSHIVVGVGRVILEALSINRIPICIGNNKYVGIINKTNLLEISKVNFTDRNSSRSLAPEYFINDLIKINNHPEQIIRDISETIQIAKKNFDIGISAGKHEEFYSKIISAFSKKRFTIEDLLKYKQGINGVESIRTAFDLKRNGFFYSLDNAKSIRILVIPNFSLNKDKWITILTELIKIRSIHEKATIVIRIQNQYYSQSNEIISKLQNILKFCKGNESPDILIDCECLDEVTEALFLLEIDYFIPTNSVQYETIFKCRLLGIQIVNNSENLLNEINGS